MSIFDKFLGREKPVSEWGTMGQSKPLPFSEFVIRAQKGKFDWDSVDIDKLKREYFDNGGKITKLPDDERLSLV